MNPADIKILVGCEESQAVTNAFRNLGFSAYSNDLQDCSGGHPEYHLKMDVFEAIKLINPKCFIGFPPCTDVAVSGSRVFHIKRADGRQQRAIKFFVDLYNSSIDSIALENPVAVISSHFRKPDQIIHPYYFGNNVPKKTCLWLKNLPKLVYSMTDNLFESKTSVEPEYFIYNSKKNKTGKSKYSVFGTMSSSKNPEVAKLRSKTFPGVAQAMAEQWGNYLLTKNYTS